MSWLFSQALVAEYSAANSSDGAPSAPSNTTPTPPAFLWRDKTTDAWSRFPSGLTCEPLTVDRGEELLRWFRAGFLAKTSARPVEALESKEKEAGCGDTWRGSLAKFDPISRSWKTLQYLLQGDLESFSETWPRWGMMRDGECFPLPTLEHATYEREFGYWATPAATDDHHFCHVTMARKQRGESRPSGAQIGTCLKWEPRALPYLLNGRIHPTLHEWLMLWPTNWTDFAAPATAKFQQWQRLHGVCSEGQTPIMCQGEEIK
jgi:hypothetical protein